MTRNRGLIFDRMLRRPELINPASLLAILCLYLIVGVTGSTRLGKRTFVPLSSEQIQSLVAIGDPEYHLNPLNTRSHLSKILIPRPVESENITIVKEYIISTLERLNWHIDKDTFIDNTPYGKKVFTNIIATKDPAAASRVILAAHYDSKFFPSYPYNQFVGATDSAAPCAMMLDLAETLDPLLNSRQQRLEDGTEEEEDVAETTLQLVFFDGEEAFKEWTATDSIYGARHLADKWATTYINPHSKRRLLRNPVSTEMSTIEHLILLDLLGAPNPTIRSFFPDTGWLFDEMINAETKLRDNGFFDVEGKPSRDERSWFTPRSGSDSAFGWIEDDHIPFIRHGVNILHVITSPFPWVWHKLSDDASALDMPTLKRWNLILRVFMSEYLNLRPEDFSRQKIQRSEDELVRSV